MAAEVETLTGWLHKKLQGGKKWKKCWYVLDTENPATASISHFVHATMARTDRGADRLATDNRDEIPLSSIKRVLHQKKGMKFILLLNSGANVHLKANGEAAAKNWVTAIERAKKWAEEEMQKEKAMTQNSAEMKDTADVYMSRGAKSFQTQVKKNIKKKKKKSNAGQTINVDTNSEMSCFDEININDIPPPPPMPPPDSKLAATMKRVKNKKPGTLEVQAPKRFDTDIGPRGNGFSFRAKAKAGSAKVSRKNVSVGPRRAVMPVGPRTKAIDPTLEIPKFRKKNDKTRNLLLDTLTNSTSLSQVLFSELNESAVQKLVDKMYRVHVKHKEDVVKQGVQGSEFYIIESGRFHIYLVPNDDNVVQRQVAGIPQLVAQKGSGAFFGELALLYEQPSIVTVRAATDGVLWAISRPEFHELTKEVALEQAAEKKNLLKSSEILGALLSDKDMTAIADAMEYRDYETGDVIFSPGEALTSLLFLSQGAIDVYDDKGSKLSEMEIGESFGEIGLLEEYKIEYKFVAGKPKPRCVLLDIQETEGVVGSLKEMVQKRWAKQQTLAERRATKENPDVTKLKSTVNKLRGSIVQRFTLGTKSTDYSIDLGSHMSSVSVSSDMSAIDRDWEESPPLLTDVKFSCLKPIKLLGRGNFGQVHLVVNNHPNPLMLADTADEVAPEYFALKVLSRDFITDNGWEEMADNEKRAMAELSYHTRSPFIVRLFHSFADKKNIYLLLELCDGGDLYQLMRTQPGCRMDEKNSRFYAACVATGLEAMHKRTIVYRDLKPENLILAQNGFVKIADFGLAKKTLRTFTVCGTPDYMAPETILSRGHDIAVDWWAIGVLLFELTLGQAPFPGRDPMDIYENILAHKSGELTVPPGVKVTARFVDIMNALMHPKKTKRLGCLKAGAESVRNHAFFSDFDWTKFNSFQMKPPIMKRKPKYVDLGSYDPEYDCEPDDISDWKPDVDTVLETTPTFFNEKT